MSEPLAFIEGGQLYLATELKRRLGIGDWAWRRMRRRGLRVLRFGRHAYVLGRDAIEFLVKESAEDSDE
jgi:hypothetical protein